MERSSFSEPQAITSLMAGLRSDAGSSSALTFGVFASTTPRRADSRSQAARSPLDIRARRAVVAVVLDRGRVG